MNKPISDNLHILTQLEQTIIERKATLNNQSTELLKPSYIAQLLTKGDEAILKKVIEESGEVLMASKTYSLAPNLKHKQALVAEVADLWFHSVVLLQYHDLSLEDVMQELQKRQAMSGIQEKANRK